MPRKTTNRNAASSAAAASNSTGPTFTSFAAATAHVLGAPNATSSTSASAASTIVTPWDAHAHAILKRLTKRDATTKQRALADLQAHVETRPVDGDAAASGGGDGSGASFLAAWAATFPSLVLDDPSPAVRAAVVTVMSCVVRAFGRATAAILPNVIAPWVASTGDCATAVAKIATHTLDEAFPSPERRPKVAVRYVLRLCDFCIRALPQSGAGKGGGNSNGGGRPAAVVAVLQWMLQATGNIDHIASVIDKDVDPLRTLVRLSTKTTTTTAKPSSVTTNGGGTVAPPTPRAVADLLISIIRHTATARHGATDSSSDDASAATARLTRVATLTVTLAHAGSPSAWDIVLVLLHDAPREATAVLEKITDALAAALVVPAPAALGALLPVVDALPVSGGVAAAFVQKMVAPMRKRLLPKEGAEAPATAYALAALVPYAEVLAFVQHKADTKWFADGEGEAREAFLVAWHYDFVRPVCAAFITGVLPPVGGSQPKANNGVVISRVMTGDGNLGEIAVAMGRLFRQMAEEHATAMTLDVANVLLDAVGKHDADELLSRFVELLMAVGNPAREGQLVRAIVEAAVGHREGDEMLNELHVLSAVLVTRGACEAVVRDWEIVDKLLEMGRLGLKRMADGSRSQDDLQGLAKRLAVMYSWAVWIGATTDVDNVLDRVLHDFDEMLATRGKWLIVTELVEAHQWRRCSNIFSLCAPLKGVALETIVQDTSSLLSDNIGVRLMSVLIDSGGGADVSVTSMEKIAVALAAQVRQTPTVDTFDCLILPLLESPIQHMNQSAMHFEKLAIASFWRGIFSAQVMAVIISRLSSLMLDDMTDYVRALLRDVNRTFGDLSGDANWNWSKVGSALAKGFVVVGENNLENSVLLCKQLVCFSRPEMVRAVLCNVPWSVVFGDGSRLYVHVDLFFDVMERMNGADMTEVSPHLDAFLNSMKSDHAVSTFCSDVADRILQDKSTVALDVMKVCCASQRNRVCRNRPYEGRHPFFAIADVISEAVSNSGEEFGRVPQLMFACVTESRGLFLDYAEDALTSVTHVILRDAITEDGMKALDVMSAALSSQDGEASPWLRNLVTITLRSIRRCLEQQVRGLSKAVIEDLEAHCACYVRHCVESLGIGGLTSDDVRFWTMRARDGLERVVRRMEAEGDAAGLGDRHERVGWLCNLTEALVDNIDDETLAADICHFGAWAGLYLVGRVRGVGKHMGQFDQVGADGWAGLAIRAAERGVLMGEEGEFPGKAETVYALVQWLGSESADVRNAVMGVVAHVAAIVLPGVVDDRFPENGFANEGEETEFAERVIPTAMADGLRFGEGGAEWEEVRYFLTWRLFLEGVVGATGDEGVEAERSVRRIGVSFLRRRGDIVVEFLRRCADVLVEGSITERRFGAEAAEEVLRATMKKRVQGLGLALADDKEKVEEKEKEKEKMEVEVEVKENEKEKEKIEKEDVVVVVERATMLEKEVGRAAGIAFARALQRVPAVCRLYIGESVDRGTMKRVEEFVRRCVSPALIAGEIEKVREWGSFGGGGGDAAASSSTGENEGEVHVRGSVAGREMWATYTLSDVTTEIGVRLPEVYPLETAGVEAMGRIGMSEARWRKTLLSMTMLLRGRDGSLAEAVDVWRRNLDKTFAGADECPICYSVLHVTTAALPKKQCRTCHHLFHNDCLCKWFTKSNSSACPLCRSAF